MAEFKIQFAKSKREKALLFTFVVMSAMTLYFYIFLKPAINTLSTVAPKVSILKKELDDAKYLVSNKENIEKSRVELARKLEGYNEFFPGEQELQRLLKDFSNLASESNVKIIGIKPLAQGEYAAKKTDMYEERPYKIMAKSGYHELGRFIQRLETGRKFIAVKDIKIAADEKDIARHNVELVASAYVLVKEKEKE